MAAKTVAEKLLIKPGSAVWVTPPSRRELIEPLPSGTTVVEAPTRARAAIVFADDARSLRAVLSERGSQLAEPDVLWIAYPKANRSDLNRDKIPPLLTEYSMRPIGQVAIDDVWSALRFRPLKPGEAQFSRRRTTMT